MMPHEPVLDLMRRTMVNLAFVEGRATQDGPYEVTQLINSFLGAVAHPWESLRNELNSILIEDAANQGWLIPQPELVSDQVPMYLGDLIRQLRNGIAHGNITFLPGRHGEIAALRIVNRDRSGKRTWGAILTTEHLRRILERFVSLVEEIDVEVRCPHRIA